MTRAVLLFFLAAPVLHFQVTDGRGKETNAIMIEAGAPDEDGWHQLELALHKGGKFKGDPVLVWPFDGAAKKPDGPEPIPAIVIQRGDEKSLANKQAVAAIATPVMLGVASLDDIARKTGFTTAELIKAFGDLIMAEDAFEKGVGLLYAGKYAEAAKSLDVALRERERQLTRMPSEIYPAAMLDGLALSRAGNFDGAAVAYLMAVKQRPSDEIARKLRSEALVRAGKPEAAGR